MMDLYPIYDQINGNVKTINKNKPAVNVGCINKGSDGVVLLSFADHHDKS